MSLGCTINGCTINTAPINGCCFGAELIVAGHIDAYVPSPVFFDVLIAECIDVPGEDRNIEVPKENRVILIGKDGHSCGVVG